MVQFKSAINVLLLAIAVSADTGTYPVNPAEHPWLTPFIFGNPTIKSFYPDSISKKRLATISLTYDKFKEVGQRLYPRIDSAASAEGWIKTDMSRHDSVILCVTYWKDLQDPAGYKGPQNITFTLAFHGCINVEWAPFFTDSAILYDVAKAHDTTDKIFRQTQTSIFNITKYLHFMPQSHPLYNKLVSELEYFALRHPEARVRASVIEKICNWGSGPKREIALSIYKQMVTGDPNRITKLHAALYLFELGDATFPPANDILKAFASGNIMDSLTRQELGKDEKMPSREMEMKKLWREEARRALGKKREK